MCIIKKLRTNFHGRHTKIYDITYKQGFRGLSFVVISSELGVFVLITLINVALLAVAVSLKDMMKICWCQTTTKRESRGKPWDLLYMPVSCLWLWSCGTRQSRHTVTCLSHPLKKEYGTYANPLDYTYMQMLQRSHWFLCGSSPETPAIYTVADCYFSIIWQHSNFICYIACFCFLSLLIITLKGLYAIGTRGNMNSELSSSYVINLIISKYTKRQYFRKNLWKQIQRLKFCFGMHPQLKVNLKTKIDFQLNI